MSGPGDKKGRPLLCAAGGFAFLYGLELVLTQLFGNFLPGGGGGQSGL